MVDVSAKATTHRQAVARARITAKPETVDAVRHNTIAKGDVIAVARVAGIMAAKATGDLIPLCHPIALTSVDVAIDIASETSLIVTVTARTVGPTGVEMEALTAAAVAALTIYDMCKATDRGMTISDLELVEKSGGKSGTWRRT